MAPRLDDSRSFRISPRINPETVTRLHDALDLDQAARDTLFDGTTQADLPQYASTR
ncbi:hypothetical protein [Halovulum sp. GXIMD14793]